MDPSEISEHDKVALFAHFDRDDVIGDHVIHYLKCLRGLDIQIVFVSTSNLSDDQVAGLKLYCLDVIVRENVGHDFASWKHAFNKYHEYLTGHLFLLNDSVYGPVGNLGEALQRLKSVEADCYGMVGSSEISPHLQSWFLILSPDIYKNPLFFEFINIRFEDWRRDEIILRGEIGLMEVLKAGGFRSHALFNASDSSLVMRRFPRNPMHWMWKTLLIKYGVPFIKVDMIVNNESYIYNVEEWRNIVLNMDVVVARMIENHFGRIGRIHSRKIMPKNEQRHHWILYNLYNMNGAVRQIILVSIYQIYISFRLRARSQFTV
jgi:lipopolysaccharide biosynthesis protein